jgi:8-oxo-dGTP pyrophosphatase MutT (NUDIX family)
VDDYIDLLTDALKKPLPGWEAHRKMINYARPKSTVAEHIDPGAKRGSVLALLYPVETEPHLVLMLRTPHRGAHGSQISFPGGRHEENDRDMLDTALREAQEEVGIDRNQVEVIGQLSKIYIPPSRFLVTPFLGFSRNRPSFIPEPLEVAEIIEAPLKSFLDPLNIKKKPIFVKVLNREVEVKYFDIQGHVVWGATAMMLSELVDIITNQ